MGPENPEEERIDRLRRAMYSRTYAEKMGPRPRHEFETESPKISEDWKHEEIKRPEAPVPGLIRPQKNRSYPLLRWLLAVSIAFFLGAIGFFIYYLYFGGAAAVSSHNIDIGITGPPEIAGGEPVNLQVTITNRNRDTLSNANLVATFPSGTRLDPSSCSENTCQVALGTVQPGGTAAIKLPAIYQGTAGAHASVEVRLEYNLGGSNATFNAQSEYGFVYSSSPLSISIDSNSETVSGQQMQMTLTVSSNASQPIPNVLLSASLPFGFKLTAADPQSSGGNLWQLGTIVPGEQKTIQLTGTLTGETGENKVFHFIAGTKTSATSTAVDTPLSTVDLPITIAKPFLNLSLAVNDASSSQSVVVAPGQLVTVSVQYKNNLDVPIANAVVVAKLSGLAIDGTTVHSTDGFFRSTDNAVLWDKTTQDVASSTPGSLAYLAAGAGGRLTFNFQVPSTAQLQGIKNPALIISVNAAGQRLSESGVPENLQSTVTQKVTVASDLQLLARGLYFTNPFGVTGNMPPVAEAETRYAVVFSINNSTNEIDGARVTATLPPYVRLVGNHYLPATEKVNFNGTTGVFTWDVGKVAPGTGIGASSPRQVVIELGFTPSTSQINSIPVLLEDIKLTGTDALTGNGVTKTAEDITTNIAGDPGFNSINAKVACSPTAPTCSK